MPSTTSRLLVLLSLLQTRRDWPGKTLAERLEISPRTVRRDVDRLREMGYRVQATKGPEGGYRLDAGSELPPLLFDDDQAIAIGFALQSATAMGAGIEEAAVRALTTVRQVMPSRLRHRLDALKVTPLRQADADAASPDVLVALAAAIHAGETLRFDYGVSEDRRRVEPHHLVTSDARWYLIAWDLDKDDWRIFRADRIAPRIPNGPRFVRREVPGGDVRAFVSARFKGSKAHDVWPCRGRVIVDLPLRAVSPFLGDAVAEASGDGRTMIDAGSWSWVALAASFGRFDAAIEPIEPPELVAAFATLADRYGSGARNRTRP
ncbi:helix-turn-helix transcriptional regulator [Microbacterium murale]|uniref:DeoR family transcriptional regulator n=1 Tax=Microbacterium murale TaxID=1081040 RepID=A0ABQ1S3D0_9MICO|nr:WYL domain-containing protein [Microbacterium murale]GGD89703.1 DeoR family transcriptional regulator [Microbacterium murale]